MKFTEKLLAFWIVLVIIPAVLFGISVFQRSIKAEKEAATSRRLVLVQSLANEFGVHFEEVSEVLEEIIDLYPKIDEALFVSFARKMPLVKSLSLLDRTGKPILVVPTTSRIGKTDNSRALYFTEPLASGKAYLPDIAEDSVAFMSFPIHTSFGKIEAILVCEIDLNTIRQRFLEVTGSLEKSDVFIVDKHGHTFPASFSHQTNSEGHPLVAKILSGTGEWAGKYRLGKVQMFGAYAPVPSTNWRVVLEQPDAVVFSSVMSFGNAGILMFCLSVIGLLLIGFLGTRFFAHPITKLTEATRELSRGEYDVKVDIKTGDEFEQLGGAFNRMAERIKTYFSVSQVLTQTMDVDSLARNMVTIIQKMADYRYAAVFLRKSETGELTLVAIQPDGSSFEFDNELRNGVMNSGKIYNSARGVLMPIAGKDRIYGLLEVASQKADEIDEETVKGLEQIARQLALALANTELYNQVIKRAEEQAALYSVTRIAGQSLKPDEILRLVMDEVLRATKHEVGSVYLWDEVRQEMVLKWHQGLPLNFVKKVSRMKKGGSFKDSPLRTGKVLVAEEIQNVPFVNQHVMNALNVRSGAFIPLKTKEEIVGAMILASRCSQRFESADVKLFTAIGEQIGVVLDNARLFTEAEKRVHHLVTISQVSQEITALLTLDDLLTKIVTLVQARFKNYCTYILFVEGDMIVGKAIATQSKMTARQIEVTLNKLRLPVDGNSVNGWVVRTGNPLLVNDVRHDSRFCRLEESEESRSELVAPIQLEGKIIGTLGIQSDKLNAFDEIDLWTFQSMASQIGIAIENARLYEQTTVLKKLTESVIATLASGVIYVNTDGKVEIFNRTMGEMLGVRPAEAVGKSPRIVKEALELTSCPFQQVLQSGKPLVYYETKLKRTDETQLTIGMSIIPLKDEAKRIIGAVGLFVDLTALKAIEAEQQQIRDLALLGGTVTRLAHEIKNPLASILSGIQLLQRRLEPKKEHLEYLETIVGEIRRLDSSLKELLVFSKPQESQFILESPLVPLEKVLKFLEPQLTEQRITVVRDFDSSLPPVRIDPQKMEQVFLNLILNAVQSSDKDSEIRVSAKVHSHNNFSVVRYEITDFGSGIPKENLDRIFDPFFSTKTHGIGLGLPIVRRIVEEHGGSSTVKSKPGKGTTFVVQLTTEKV